MGHIIEPPIQTAERLVEACLAVLAVPVRSVILHGSLAMDAFVPGQSDLDLLVVVAKVPSLAEADALENVVRRADLGSACGLDLDLVHHEIAAAPTPAPALALRFGRYPGAPLERQRDVASAPDLLAELSIARACGRRMFGAAPHEVLGAVPPAWIAARIDDWLAFWQTVTDDRAGAQYMVLSACRMWRFRMEGVHASKADAARWALARDPSLAAVREALHQRFVDPATPISEDGIARLLATVRRELGSP